MQLLTSSLNTGKMKTVTFMFRLGLILLVLWALLQLLLTVSKYFVGEGAYEFLSYDLWLGLFVIFLKFGVDFCLTASVLLFMYFVTNGWAEGKKNLAIQFEFEEETKTEKSITDANSDPNYSRSSRKQPKMAGKP